MAEKPTGEWWRALTEPAATALTGAAATPIAGIGGLLSLLHRQDPKAAAEVVQRLQQSMTYEPRTEQGNAGLAGLGAVMDPINKALEFPGKTVGQASPATGALTTGALSAFLPFRRASLRAPVRPPVNPGFNPKFKDFTHGELWKALEKDPRNPEVESELSARATGDPYAEQRRLMSDAEGRAMDRAVGGGQEPPVRSVTTSHHGTPYTFPATPNNPLGEFDMSKVGAGEGAAAYGHGIYSAGNREVGTEYRDKLGGFDLNLTPKPATNVPIEARNYLRAHGGNLDQALDELENYAIPNANKLLDMNRSPDRKAFLRKAQNLYNALDYLRELKGSGTQVEIKPNGRLYTIEIPHESHLLDWDKPLGEQPKTVRDAVSSFTNDRGDYTGSDWTAYFDKPRDGASIHQALSRALGGDKEAAAYLHSQGVPGIKYLDQGSREAGEGSHNYVIFHPNDATIKHREAHGGLIKFARGGAVAMPFKSAKQARLMRGISHGWTPRYMQNPPSRAVAEGFVNDSQKVEHYRLGGMIHRAAENIAAAGGGTEPTILGGSKPYVPLPAPTSGMEHGEPGSITRMLWDKYSVVDPTARNYDQFARTEGDPYQHMAVDDPNRIQNQQWDAQRVREAALRAPRGGLQAATAPEGPYLGGGASTAHSERLRAHKQRIEDILNRRGKAQGGPVRMQLGGPVPMMGPDTNSGGLLAAMKSSPDQGMIQSSSEPLWGGQAQPGQMPGQMHTRKPPPLPPGMMFPQPAPLDMGGDMRMPLPTGGGPRPIPEGSQGSGGLPMGGPRLPSSMQGVLQKLRMQNRPRDVIPRNRIGAGDQQGGLARAMQTQTGRPPISRRMAFPGTR